MKTLLNCSKSNNFLTVSKMVLKFSSNTVGFASASLVRPKSQPRMKIRKTNKMNRTQILMSHLLAIKLNKSSTIYKITNSTRRFGRNLVSRSTKTNAFRSCSICRVLEILVKNLLKKRRKHCVERLNDWNNSCNKWLYHTIMLVVSKPGKTIRPLTRRYCKLSASNWKSKSILISEISTLCKTYWRICWKSSKLRIKVTLC